MKKLLLFVLILAAAFIKPSGLNDIGSMVNRGYVDNANHGWEVKRNKTHTRPDIPIGAREMLDMYGAVYAGNSDKKVVYLTIDLGYENGNTGAVLDVLKKNGVEATFFIVSSYLERNSDMVDRIVNEGHSLQNHTSNYKHLYTLSDEAIKKEVMDMHCEVERRYGVSMKYLRPPYEEWSYRAMKVIKDLGYKPVFWSIACADWMEDKDASYIYNSVMANHHNGAVILLHTVSKASPKALDMIIKGLKGQGYEFVILDM